MEIKNSTHSDLAIPPGEYLEEVIETLGMTKDELARRMARPASKLSPIFKGEKSITPDTALQLEKVVGVPAHVWLGLEAEYRLTLARQQEEREEDHLQDEAALLDSYCYAELARLGEVAKHTRPADKVRELHRFFGVASLTSVSEVRRYQAAFRCAGNKPKPSHALEAWLRMGELKAFNMPCSPFKKTTLKSNLDEIRAMTLSDPPKFHEPLVASLAGAGVALVIAQHLRGTKANGATFWLGRNKSVVMLTIRGSWADIFWFSLFHELGHILLHDKQAVFIEGDYESPEYKVREREADDFACETLIPSSLYRDFVNKGNFLQPIINGFARELGIHPGIVVGRLQHDGHIRHDWRNELRVRYKYLMGT